MRRGEGRSNEIGVIRNELEGRRIKGEGREEENPFFMVGRDRWDKTTRNNSERQRQGRREKGFQAEFEGFLGIWCRLKLLFEARGWN
jgi:hypothetical protein